MVNKEFIEDRLWDLWIRYEAPLMVIREGYVDTCKYYESKYPGKDVSGLAYCVLSLHVDKFYRKSAWFTPGIRGRELL